MKATAIANANIALVKYWGKRNADLILPHNGSVSMTCDGLQTRTTVEFAPEYSQDVLVINDEEMRKDEKDIMGHMERIRKMAGLKEHAKMVSETNFPIAAGLASSASGLAALTLAATKASGLSLGERELTILTRMGSGSACRSIVEGFAEWRRGEKEDGSDSYAETIAPKSHWPDFRIIATILTEKKKAVGSRAGMAQTVKTCPYYKEWLSTVNEDIRSVKKGIQERDFTLVGETAEFNCLKMHATMMTTKPPIVYWIPETLDVIHWTRAMRESGTPCYFTIDGGPQVKVMCLEKDLKSLDKELNTLDSVLKTVVCRPGDGAVLTDRHIF
ncbi:MAG: diphosphomevalonate decarboxylase [Candidatus Aenigmarchaeota archaeon]|nr:diphosphomevalonate decarboxylase [Candidatus Aenigmarchaeota archaeon]